MDFKAIQEALRSRREALGWTLDQAAVECGLNRATIHSIENTKREPDLKPELETIERMTSAMGLTLSLFVAKLESGAGHDNRMGVVRVPPHDRSIQPVASEDLPSLQAEMGRLITRMVHAVAREQAPAARPARPSRRKGHRKNR